MIDIEAKTLKTDCFCVTILFAKKMKQSANPIVTYANNTKEESKTNKQLTAAEKQFF